MRLLFASSDITEIGRVGREFVLAGIPCGVRYDPPQEGACQAPASAELWVQDEHDFYRAVVLYLGLARNREAQTPSAVTASQATPVVPQAPAREVLAQHSQPTIAT